MGKAGRIACIFTPMVLTIASLIALACLEASGWSANSPLNNNYLMSADFSNFTVSDAGSAANQTELTAALELASASGSLKETYTVYLWSYCTANKTAGEIDWCSDRQSSFVFDPVDTFDLNSTSTTTTSTGSSTADNAIQSAIASAKANAEDFEEEVLGDTATKALKVYKRVAKWNFIAYQVAFWTTLITIIVGMLAVCSRWGSLCTWIMSAVSTLFTFLAALTTTILFSTLTGALHTILHPYNIKVSIGSRALAIAWIATAFSIGATCFWLFSICCCSGKSNPHHRSNKNNKKGLWFSEPRASRGDNVNSFLARSGTAYQRVESQHAPHDRVPLGDYPTQQPTAYQSPAPYGGAHEHPSMEPYRQQQHARW